MLYIATSLFALYIAFWTLRFSDWLYFLRPSTQLNWIFFLPGVLLIGMGLLTAGAGIKVLGITAIADMNPARTSELEIRGIYAKVRHPLYLAVICLLGGLIFIYPFPDVVTFASAFCGYVLIGAYLEERKLILIYGQKYLDYRKQVGFMIPKIPIMQK